MANKPSKSTKKLTPQQYQRQIEELTASLQRLQAEFENYKKRVATEQAELMDAAKIAVLTDLLPALDNFDRAAHHLPKELENNSWAQGMSYVGTQLEQILTELGVKKFSPQGAEFDHNEHQALEFVSSDQPEGTVVEVVTPGYTIGGRVVRPAHVKVSSGTSNYSSNDDNEGDK